MSTLNKAKYQKPIDNLSFWFDPKLGKRYYLKKDVPVTRISQCEYWDSLLEFKVYNELLNLFPQKAIERQHVINVLPAKPPFKKWTWDIDFKVTEGKDVYYIEAKGKWLLDNLAKEGFCKTLRILELFHPEIFSNLYIIGSSYSGEWCIPGTTIKVQPLSKIKEVLAWNKQLTTVL